MLLEVKRDHSALGCTVGTLYVDGQFECFTLEDVVREVPQEAVEKWKVPGETAIPSGTYDVMVNRSSRFQRLLPLLLNVPGFEGVRIHPGNFAGDTEGCILVGKRRAPAAVLDSRSAFNVLFPKIEAAVGRGEKIQIRITNPPVIPSPRETELA
jgi:hypothetical protein